MIDEDPQKTEEYPPKRYYDKFSLIQSIEKEVANLLNTRATARRDQYEELGQTVLNYGLPEMHGLVDFSQLDGSNRGEWGRICRLIEQTIAAYEPRLINIQVSVVNFDRQKQSLTINLSADLALKEIQGEVTFPLSFSMG